jgi:CelD/BcsL family acetyltransferase involved in cellulose biosynthesis
MRIEIFRDLPTLHPLLSQWDTLAGGVPFRQWAWLGPWWNAYGQGHELLVLAVYDNDSLTGIVPWYVDDRGAQGRAIRVLGSGEVCSEYITLLARAGSETAVGEAVGDWLIASDSGHCSNVPRWDWVEFANVPPEDVALSSLRSRMTQGGYTQHERPGLACWQLAIPKTWDEYVASLSRGHRRRVRDCCKRMQRPDAALYTATDDNFERAWRVLVDLHQQRWNSQGEKGCFANAAFGSFLHNAARALLSAGTLRLKWIELGGRPASCAIAMCAGGVYYVYQTGMATELSHENPGWLMQSAAIRDAMDAGCHTYDLLRGNEPYKGHLKAEPHETIDVRIVSRRLTPRLRHQAWLTGNLVKHAIKSSLSATGMLSAMGMV